MHMHVSTNRRHTFSNTTKAVIGLDCGGTLCERAAVGLQQFAPTSTLPGDHAHIARALCQNAGKAL